MATKTARKPRHHAKRRQRKRARKIARRTLIDRASKLPLMPGGQFQGPPSGQRKFSEVIIEFGQPVLYGYPTDDAFRSAVSLVALVWNMALVPPKIREEMKDKMIADLSQGDTGSINALRPIIDMLLDRKKELYADDERVVADYELIGGNGKWHLQVCYTMSA